MAIKFFLAELFKKTTRGGGKFAPPTKIGLIGYIIIRTSLLIVVSCDLQMPFVGD